MDDPSSDSAVDGIADFAPRPQSNRKAAELLFMQGARHHLVVRARQNTLTGGSSSGPTKKEAPVGHILVDQLEPGDILLVQGDSAGLVCSIQNRL